VNEAWLRLINQSHLPAWEDRTHFFGIAARLMRLVPVDYARARRAGKRGGAAEAVTLHDRHLLSSARAPDVLEADEALDQLAKVDAHKAKAIEWRYLGGMEREEIGTALDLTVPTAMRDLAWGRLGSAGSCLAGAGRE
jgi:RNA polymerase sigma factor (TIGR02999 family)